MALDRLTKIDGGGISTTSDYRVGVITATKFVGPVEGAVTGTASTATLAVNAQGLTGTPDIVVGIITASSANFSGNVTIGGTLTYEDVTNIDSVGLITARNGIHVKTGTATTALVVEGDGRVTGILTVGTSSLKLDGPNNVVNVGTALTLGHSQGVQFHTQNLHSAGFEVNQINASGIITATEADINGDIDVVGVSTLGSGGSGQVFIKHQGSTRLETTSTGIKAYGNDHLFTTESTGDCRIILQSDSDNNAENDNSAVVFRQDGSADIGAIGVNLTNSTSIPLSQELFVAASSGESAIILATGFSNGYNNAVERVRINNAGVTTFTENVFLNKDLDVDGHTNLDNVNIAGVVTATRFVGNGDRMSGIHTVATNPAVTPSNSLLAIGNAGSYRFIQSHGGQELRINSAGNDVILPATRAYVGSNPVANITNNADNRVITGGSNGVINGEANLIYNGSGLGIGESSPANLLHVKVSDAGITPHSSAQIVLERDGTNYLQFLTTAAATSGILFGDTNDIDVGKLVYDHNLGDMQFQTEATVRMALTGTGDLKLPDDAAIELGGSLTSGNGDLRIYHTTSGTSWIRHTNSSEYFILEGNQMDFRDYATGVYRARMGTAVQLYYNGNNVKLSTTNTGITVTGEVAASQDYPDFEPVLNFNFAGSSTQLDPRLLYRRSGVASFYDANGLVKLVGENTPRFDHDPISRKNKGILIEHSRTNLFLFGTTPGDNWTGSKAGTFEENTTETTAPDGTFTATKWTFTTTDPYLYQTTTLNANTTYTMSMWVKAGTNMAGDWLQFRLGGAPYSTQGNSIIPADGTWRRISYTKTVGGSNETSVSVGFEPQTSPSGNPAAGDVIYIWGAQLEVGGYVSSFIPTYGRSQTRGADLLVIDGDDSTALSDAYNDQEGTLVVEYHNVTTDGSYVATIDDGSGDNRFGISNSNSSQGISVSGGSSQGQLDNGTPIVGATNKMAHAYKLNDRGLSINGNDATQDNGFALPTGIRFIWIGCRQGSYDFLGSTISRFMYYTKRLPNSQLKLLTSQ